MSRRLAAICALAACGDVHGVDLVPAIDEALPLTTHGDVERYYDVALRLPRGFKPSGHQGSQMSWYRGDADPALRLLATADVVVGCGRHETIAAQIAPGGMIVACRWKAEVGIGDKHERGDVLVGVRRTIFAGLGQLTCEIGGRGARASRALEQSLGEAFAVCASVRVTPCTRAQKDGVWTSTCAGRTRHTEIDPSNYYANRPDQSMFDYP